MNKKLQTGQALLVVILVMVIGLTLALSLVSRSVTNLKTSTEEENSQRSLSAAEAGLNRALLQTSTANLSGSLTNSTSYVTQVTQQSADTFDLDNGAIITRDVGADVWFSTFSAGVYSNLWNGGVGTFIYWDSAGTNCLGGAGSESNINNKAAIELIYLYTSDGGVTQGQWRVGFDPCPSRAAQNHFFTTGPTYPNVVPVTSNALPPPLSGYTYAVGIGLSGLGSGYFLRIIPLYADTKIGIYSPGLTANGRTQGNIINSVGHLSAAANQIGDVQRKISAFRSIPNIQTEFLQYGILSP